MAGLLFLPNLSIINKLYTRWQYGHRRYSGHFLNCNVINRFAADESRNSITKPHQHRKSFCHHYRIQNCFISLLFPLMLAVSLSFSGGVWAQGADSLYIERILIIGNDHTKEEIIRREMQLQEGDFFDAQIAEQDRQRITNLRLFHRVDIQTYKGEIGLVVCVIVTERWYIMPVPMLYLHNKNWDELSYGVGLTWENLWGRNITATTAVWFGFNRSVSVRYQHPWLFSKKRISFDGSIFFSRMPQISVEYDEFDVVRNGGLITMGWRAGYHSTIFLSVGYQQVHLPENRFLSVSGRLYDRLPQIGGQFLFDRRDYYAYPKQGWYVLISGLAVNDGGPMHFGFLKWDIRRYQQIYAQLSIGARACWELGLGKIPVYERLLIGQQVRIRGHFYELHEGESRFIASVEGRYPLIAIRHVDVNFPASAGDAYGQKLPIGLSAAVFIDTGSVWYQRTDYRKIPFSTGYGVGLHLHLPYVELLRLERAWDLQGRGQYIIDLKTWF